MVSNNNNETTDIPTFWPGGLWRSKVTLVFLMPWVKLFIISFVFLIRTMREVSLAGSEGREWGKLALILFLFGMKENQKRNKRPSWETRQAYGADGTHLSWYKRTLLAEEGLRRAVWMAAKERWTNALLAQARNNNQEQRIPGWKEICNFSGFISVAQHFLTWGVQCFWKCDLCAAPSGPLQCLKMQSLVST